MKFCSTLRVAPTVQPVDIAAQPQRLTSLLASRDVQTRQAGNANAMDRPHRSGRRRAFSCLVVAARLRALNPLPRTWRESRSAIRSTLSSMRCSARRPASAVPGPTRVPASSTASDCRPCELHTYPADMRASVPPLRSPARPSLEPVALQRMPYAESCPVSEARTIARWGHPLSPWSVGAVPLPSVYRLRSLRDVPRSRPGDLRHRHTVRQQRA
jgi:hypothetical protein